MPWFSIASGLVGAVGLLFGLWQRAVAKAAKQKADALVASLAQARADLKADGVRYEAFITQLQGEIARLKHDLDTNLSPAGAQARLGELLSWRVQPRPANAPAAGVPQVAAP